MTKIKVGIEASDMLVLYKTGMENATTGLVLSLVDHLASQSDVGLYLYFHTGSSYAHQTLLPYYYPRLETAQKRFWPFRRGYKVGLGYMALWDRLDLLHIPSPYLPRLKPCPTVITFHDFAWKHLTSEGAMLEAPGADKNALSGEDILKVSTIIANSDATRRDIIEHYQISPDRVVVTHFGVDAQSLPTDGASAIVREKYGLGPYLLNVAALQYRKNQVRLLQAFAILKSVHNIPHQLVIVGRNGNGHERVYAEHTKLGLGESVRFLGYVPDEDIPALYSAADVVVYPSIHEGFGFPILEAFRCGAVLVASNCSSMPEIGGDGALYCDPYDVEDIASKILAAITDEALRQNLVRQGQERVKGFSWEKTARETLDVYKGVIEKHRGEDLDGK